MQQHATHQEPVDDEHLTNAHQQAYQQDNASGMSAGSIGSAAAMQVSTCGLTCYLSLDTIRLPLWRRRLSLGTDC